MPNIYIGRGNYTEVDEEDLEWLLTYYTDFNCRRTEKYAFCFGRRKNRNYYMVHRLIAERMELDITRDIDHIDRNGHNNKRNNLRYATRSQNQANSLKRSSINKYKGVTRTKSGKWQARIKHDYEIACLGTYSLEEQAAMAYDRAAIKLFGEFANLNFPKENYCVKA